MRTGELWTSDTPALLIFDGDCAFCTTWVDRLRSALPYFPDSTPWQWLDLADYGLSESDVEAAAWLVTPTGRFGDYLAFSALLRAQPRLLLRVVGRLIAMPPVSWCAGLGYRLIARYRHRLPGGTPACQARPLR